MKLTLVILLLAVGLVVVGLLRDRLRANWRRVVLAAALVAGVFIAYFVVVYVSRNRVDLIDRVNTEHPLHAQWTDADRLAAHFLSRRPPDSIKPFHAWTRSLEELEEEARRFLEGRLPRSSYVWNPGDPIEWKDAPTPHLFQLQRQAFLSAALAVDLEDPDPGLVERGLGLVEEWRQGNRVWPNRNRYAWNDDATSNRIEAQMLLMEMARALGRSNRETEIAFLRSLVHHADRLMDEAEHNYRTNHGLMQNRALLLLALSYPELDRGGDWRRTAIRRMERHLQETFSPTGVFLESPGYHWFATRSTLWFVTACRQADIDLDPIFETRLRGMLRFAFEMLYPDRSVPLIGDTFGDEAEVAEWPWDSLPDWPELTSLRAALQGGHQLPNEPVARIWREAGYFALRVPAPRWTPDSAMMLTMKAGPLPRAHGHHDALSVTLFGNGERLLTGPGYPRHYDPERRRKLIATPAQCTVSVDGASQDRGASRFILDEFRPGGRGEGTLEFAAVQAQSDLYAGVTHRRTLFYGPSSAEILIVDELISSEPHTYRQHFRVEEGLATVAEPGLLRIGRAGAERDPALLRIHVQLLEEGSLSRPEAGVVEQVAEFRADGRSLTYVALLDLAAGDPADTVQVSEGAIVWKGSRGELAIDLPVDDANAYRWSPAAIRAAVPFVEH